MTGIISDWFHRFSVRCQQNFWRHPVASMLIVVYVAVGGWLRLHHIADTLMFQADQGRDAMVVADIFLAHDLVFVGPVTSVGNMYLGPFYYYFMLPWLWLSYPSPVGPAVGVALVNIAGIWLIYQCGTKMVGRGAALWASFFLAFSRLAITYSRFSWNPNLSAVFCLLTLYGIHQALTRSTKWWYFVALMAGLLIQLHYVNLIVVAVAGILWLWQYWEHRRERHWLTQEKFWTRTVLAGLIFLATMLPLIAFDWKHDWFNLAAMTSIFTKESSFSDEVASGLLPSLTYSLAGIPGRLGHLFSTLTLPKLDVYGWRVGFGLAASCLFLFLLRLRRPCKQQVGYRILAVTLVVSTLALACYRHSVFDHYVLFFLPVVFLILGSLLTSITPTLLISLPLYLLVAMGFLVSNYQEGFFAPANFNPANLGQTVDAIVARLPEDDSYNLVLYSDSGDFSGINYRFLMRSRRPNLLEPAHSDQADHLFAIDEIGVEDIFDTPNFEIITYPNRDIQEVFYPDNHQTTIYHLEREHE